MTTHAVHTPLAAPVDRDADTLAKELSALRAKAARIVDELAALYRQMAELQEQVTAHQQRHGRQITTSRPAHRPRRAASPTVWTT